MKARLLAAAVAAMSFSGLTMSALAEDPNMTANAPITGRDTASNSATTQPTNTLAANPSSADVKEIQDLLGRTVETAVSKGNFDSLISNLSKPDRDRIGSAKSQNWTDLDGRIDQFRKDWQAKYGQDFKLADKGSVIFGDPSFRVVTGPMNGANNDNARTAGERMAPAQDDANNFKNQPLTPPNANGQTPGPTVSPRLMQHDSAARSGIAQTPSEINTLKAQATNTITADGQNNQNNQKTAQVQIPATEGAPAVNLQLVNEGALVNAWRIDIPDNVDGQRLHDNLLTRLTSVDDAKANWPSDVNQAYILVSHQILSALAGGDVQRDAGQPAVQPTTPANGQ